MPILTYGEDIQRMKDRFERIADEEGTEPEQIGILKYIYQMQKQWYDVEGQSWCQFEIDPDDVGPKRKSNEMLSWLALHSDINSYMLYRAPKRRFYICVKDPEIATLFRLTWI